VLFHENNIPVNNSKVNRHILDEIKEQKKERPTKGLSEIIKKLELKKLTF
jgi:hypothetical protein